MSSRMVTTSVETIFAALLRNEISPDGERHIGPVPEFPEFPPPEPPRRDEHGHRPIGPVDEWEEERPTLRVPSSEELRRFAAGWLEEVDEDNLLDLRSASAYGEPGYLPPEMPILMADWNRVSDQVQRWLEGAGYELEWGDEWGECEFCCCAVRTQSDSYEWRPSYALLAGEICCAACVAKRPEEYLAGLRGDAGKVHTLLTLDLSKHGYVRVDRNFETGLHPGQDDSPIAVAAVLAASGIEDFIFSLDRAGQFDARFSLWLRPADARRFRLDPTEGKAKVSPAAAMEAALRDAARIPLGPGISYTTVTLTDEGATVTHRSLTPEEFVAGILFPTTPHTDIKE